MENTKELYLDLIKKCLTDAIYQQVAPQSWRPKLLWNRVLNKLVSLNGMQVIDPKIPIFDLNSRIEGRDWPSSAHTMIGMKRLDILQFCIEDVIKKSIPGDLIETGVWRGGAAIFMRAVLKASGITDRLVWAADSFEGLPAPNSTIYPADANDPHHRFPQLAVSIETVKSNFEKYGLLDDQVQFLKGWFKDTLPTAPIERLAVLRLDGDMYESTIDALVSLYPKLSVGGYLIVDDYSYPSCRQAILDYRKSNAITEQIVQIDWSGVYWQRTKN